MNYTEEEIWKKTPKQFKSQLDVHVDIQKQLNGSTKGNKNNNNQAGYIDQLSGW